MNDYPTATRVKPHRPRMVVETEVDPPLLREMLPYVFQTVRNITTVVVSVMILAIVFRVYMSWESGRQMDALKAAREEVVAKNLARQAEIKREMEHGK